MQPGYWPLFMRDRAQEYFELLEREVPWSRHTETREEYFMAKSPTSYTYGAGRGVRTYVSNPYLPFVEMIQDWIQARRMPSKDYPDSVAYNVCFLNRYADASQHLGWHSDDSSGTDPGHPIAVVSFGEAREIWWREIGHKGEIPMEQRRLLEPGSLFVMPPWFQGKYQHKIPRGDRKMGTRISLTFRRIGEARSIVEHEDQRFLNFAMGEIRGAKKED